MSYVSSISFFFSRFREKNGNLSNEELHEQGGESAATLSVMEKGKAETGGGKRGKVMALPDIQPAESTYRAAVRNCKPGSSVGFKKLGLPTNLKETDAEGIQKELRAGESAGDISQETEESRKWSDSKKKVSGANAKRAKEFLKKDESAMANSTRLLAAKVGVGRTTAQTIISKRLQMRPLKHVKVTYNTAATRSKRKKLAQHPGNVPWRNENLPHILVRRDVG